MVCVLFSFSQPEIHCPKEIGGEGSPSGKDYGQTETGRVRTDPSK